jgi:hypothetical protein
MTVLVLEETSDEDAVLLGSGIGVAAVSWERWACWEFPAGETQTKTAEISA